MRTVTLRRSLVALFAAAISFGAITQAQAAADNLSLIHI